MNPIKTSLIIASCLSLAALPSAFAGQKDEHGHSADAMLKAMDTDGDGRVSSAEHSAGVTKKFNEMDTNHDGNISAAEMAAFHGMKSEKPEKEGKASTDKFMGMDTNGDGQLSQAEFSAGAQAKFAKMDTDGDGFLSPSECAAGEDKMKMHKKSAE